MAYASGAGVAASRRQFLFSLDVLLISTDELPEPRDRVVGSHLNFTRCERYIQKRRQRGDRFILLVAVCSKYGTPADVTLDVEKTVPLRRAVRDLVVVEVGQDVRVEGLRQVKMILKKRSEQVA